MERQDRSSAPQRRSPADAPTPLIAPGVTMADVDELTRRARSAESDGDVREALRLYRRALEAEPAQEVAVRAARLLDREGRTDEAVDLLRESWEERTGRRLPAGEIERTARRLDPDADLASWTPEWPPGGEDREPPARVVRAVEGADAAGGGGPGRERPAQRDAPRGDGAGDGGPGDGSGGGRDDGGEDDRAPSRRFVRRYDRRPGGNGGEGDGPRRLGPRDGATAGSGGEAAPGGEPDAGAGEEASRPGGGSDGNGGGREPGAANGTGDLRRGLEVLEDLLELSPRDRRLRRRKVRYARRLGDPELLGEALVELGELLDGEGAHRGARLLYEEAGSADAEPGAAPTAGDEDVDEGFRRRLSEALERAPRELQRLQRAGMEAVAAEGAGAVPWRAHRELGRYLLLRGRPDEAVRHLAAARERAPDEGGEEAADALYELGLAHRRAGRPREARDCFRRLAERDPGFAVAWEALST